MSAEGRARIAEAQRQRWATYYEKHGKPATKPASKAVNRVLSPAVRKRISDATKKRWAAYRAARRRENKTDQE